MYEPLKMHGHWTNKEYSYGIPGLKCCMQIDAAADGIHVYFSEHACVGFIICVSTSSTSLTNICSFIII